MIKLKVKLAGAKVEYEGSEEFLQSHVAELIQMLVQSHNDQVRQELSNALADIQRDLTAMDQHVETMSRLHEAVDQLLEQVKDVQETQLSFNLQYLQLQSQMQHESQTYTTLSNVMKTKHDTVKNTISNIR